MALAFLRDDNGTPLHDVTGLRPNFATVVSASSGAAIAETSIATVNVAANRSSLNAHVIIRVAVVGTNAVSFSLGAAGSVPADTTTMITLLGNSVSFMKAKTTDVSMYLKQITGASTVEVTAMV